MMMHPNYTIDKSYLDDIHTLQPSDGSFEARQTGVQFSIAVYIFAAICHLAWQASCGSQVKFRVMHLPKSFKEQYQQLHFTVCL